MKLGQILDGLVTVYHIYKSCKTKKMSVSLSQLKRNLKEIYENLPIPIQNDYRKKRLRMREEDIQLIDGELYNRMIKLIRQSMGLSADIYRTVSASPGSYPWIVQLSKIFGGNTEFSKYFFKELGRNEEDVFILEILPPHSQRQLLPLQYGTWTVGRKGTKGNDLLIIDDHLISRPHCKIARDQHHTTVEDMKSRNATYLNGAIIRGTVPVEANDEIKVGNTLIKLKVLKSVDIVDTLETHVAKASPVEEKSFFPVMLLLAMAIVAFFMFVMVLITAFSKKHQKSSLQERCLVVVSQK